MPEGPCLMSIDHGTESIRVRIFEQKGTPLAFASQAYALKHPHSWWAELDLEEWRSCLVQAGEETGWCHGSSP
ncbi:MAG: FGGY family carbohydrate kinase [Rubrobacteraceae bacterium]